MSWDCVRGHGETAYKAETDLNWRLQENLRLHPGWAVVESMLEAKWDELEQCWYISARIGELSHMGLDT